MNILFACPPDPNPFLSNLILSLKSNSPGLEVHLGAKLFWNIERQYQIIHLHWIESLFKGWQLNREKSEQIKSRIELLKSGGAKVCLTRHNIKPHRQSDDRDHYIPILELIDGVVHMGDASKLEFDERYGGYDWHQKTVQRIISHPNYSTTPNYLTKSECRKLLGIPEDKNVVLVFGAVRSANEAKFCTDVVNHASSDFMFVCPRWRTDIQGLGARYRRKWISVPRPNDCMIGNGFVSEEEIQFYLNSADLLFLPRIGQSNLNSGIVPLAFTFGKTVVGPDYGVIGEVLKHNQNLVFPPGDFRTAAELIDKSLKMDLSPLEAANTAYSQNEMGLTQVGERYCELYEELIQNTEQK